MTETFINTICDLLMRHFSLDYIYSSNESISKSKNEPYGFDHVVREYFLNENIKLYTREKSLAKWLSKFLNSLQSFNYDLTAYNIFYTEINDILTLNKYEVISLGYDYDYFIDTPSEVQQREEYEKIMNDSQQDDNNTQNHNEHAQEIITNNQALFNEFINASNIYIECLATYFQSKSIDGSLEVKFQKSITEMDDILKKLSMFLYIKESSSFYIRIPFTSLYTLKNDWDKVIEFDKKVNRNDWLSGKPVITDTSFNFDNIRSLIGPLQKEVSTMINIKDDVIIKNEKHNDPVRVIEFINNSKLRKFELYINENYLDTIQVNKLSSWKRLYEIASKGSTSYDKTSFDYLNSGNSALHTKLGYKKTKLLESNQQSKIMYINMPNVRIGLITPKTATLRRNSILKKLNK